MKVINIKWAIDGAGVYLPESVVIKENIDEEAVADFLSDEYGFLVESFQIYNGRDWTIREIEALTEKEARVLADDTDVIKGYSVYYAELGEYFGYSCLVFKNKHHIYHVNDYQLHHPNYSDREALKTFYVEKLYHALFTEEEITAPLSDYDEYTRREHFIRNYYPMQEDYISIFGINESRADKIKKARWHYSYVGFCYFKSEEFRDKQVDLFEKLWTLKEKMADDYDYQKRAFITEMYNHEYAINWQADFDTLSAFGNIHTIRGTEDVLESYFDQLDFTEVQRKAYLDAKADYLAAVNA